jgi:hypothetical protein
MNSRPVGGRSSETLSHPIYMNMNKYSRLVTRRHGSSKVNTADKSFENATNLKYFGTTVTYQNGLVKRSEAD